MTISTKQIFFIVLGLLILYFTIIRPSIARKVCYVEAFRNGYFTQEPFRSGDYPDSVKLSIAAGNRDENYKACKVYNAGKVYEQLIFKNLRL